MIKSTSHGFIYITTNIVTNKSYVGRREVKKNILRT